MEQVAWAAIGVLGAGFAGVLGMFVTLLHRMDSGFALLGTRIDALAARLDARIDALSGQLQAHIERHAG